MSKAFESWDIEKKKLANKMFDEGIVDIGFDARKGLRRELRCFFDIRPRSAGGPVSEALMMDVAIQLSALIHSTEPKTTILCGIPRDGQPIVDAIQQSVGITKMWKGRFAEVHLRKQAENGLGAFMTECDRRGYFPGGDDNVVALIDDALSEGITKERSIAALRFGGLPHITSYNVFDRCIGGDLRLKRSTGIRTLSLFRIPDLLEFYHFDSGRIDGAQFEKLCRSQNHEHA